MPVANESIFSTRTLYHTSKAIATKKHSETLMTHAC